MKKSLVLALAGLLAFELLWTCLIIQAACQRLDRRGRHTEAVVADVLGRLGAMERERERGRGRLVVAGEED